MCLAGSGEGSCDCGLSLPPPAVAPAADRRGLHMETQTHGVVRHFLAPVRCYMNKGSHGPLDTSHPSSGIFHFANAHLCCVHDERMVEGKKGAPVLQIPTNWTQHFSFSSVAFKDKKTERRLSLQGRRVLCLFCAGTMGALFTLHEGGGHAMFLFIHRKTNPDVVLPVTSIQL